MSTLTRYWVKTAQLMKDDSTSILYSDIWTAVVKATEVEERSMMPYELTREHLLELQRNMEIKENEALRAKLEAVERERDAFEQKYKAIALCGHDHSTQWWELRANEFEQKAKGFQDDKCVLSEDNVWLREQLAAAQGRITAMEEALNAIPLYVRSMSSIDIIDKTPGVKTFERRYNAPWWPALKALTPPAAGEEG